MTQYRIPDFVPHNPMFDKEGGAVGMLGRGGLNIQEATILSRAEAQLSNPLWYAGIAVYVRKKDGWHYKKALTDYNKMRRFINKPIKAT